MKKKLLVLLITAVSTLIPNLASAIAIDVGECYEEMACAQCVIYDMGMQTCGCLDPARGLVRPVDPATGLCMYPPCPTS